MGKTVLKVKKKVMEKMKMKGGEEEDEQEEEDDDDDDDDEDDEALREQRRQAQDALHPPDPNRPFQGRTDLHLQLIDKAKLNHDIVVFRFALPRADQTLGLPLGQHILLSFPSASERKGVVQRAYTPVSPTGERGFVDFLIKLYPSGKMSNHLNQLRIGDSIHTKGPQGKLNYVGRGLFQIRRKGQHDQVQLSNIGMVAGGSGLTPMFQILQAVANDPEDHTQVSLLYANKTEGDIALRAKLEHFARTRSNIHVHFTLDQPPPDGWEGFSGFVTQDMLEQTMPAAAPDSMIFVCGPPPMVRKAVVPAALQMGFRKEQVFKF